MVPSDFAAVPGFVALAQAPETQPAVPGASGQGPAMQAVQAPAGPTGPAPQPVNPMGGLLWMLLPVMAVMFVFSMMGQRKQKKQQESLLSGLKRGDQVLTTAGIVGSVVEVGDREIVLRVDENANTRIRFVKSAVQQVIRESRDAARADVELKPKTEATNAR